MKNEQLSYAQKKGNVLINNLYFLDDHRCLYISYDDEWTIDEDKHRVPLFFDEKNYPVPKKSRKRFEQYLRGYYSINDEELFIHFHNPFTNKEYYVKGLVSNDVITFMSMTVPNSPNDIYEGGFNQADIQFKDIFNPLYTPVFEWVRPVKDIFYPPQTYLTSGFEYYDHESVHELHKQWNTKYPGVELDKNIFVSKIEYKIESDGDMDHLIREYTLKKTGDSFNAYYLIEYIGLDENSQPRLSTW